jgi:sarcosine oxidase
MTRRADVIVIGAGAMGSAAAWWLARRGRNVVVLEQFEQGHQRGSSHGGSRIFRLAYDDVTWVRRCQEALPLWHEAMEELHAPMLEITGGIDHGNEASVRAVADALAAAGAPFEWLAPEAASERWPGMRFDTPVLYQPDAGRCRADITLQAFAQGAGNAGAEVYFEQAVDELTVHDDAVVVQTDYDEYSAPVAVVAAGAWVPSLVGELVQLPPLTITEEQTFHYLPKPDDRTAWPSYIHHLDVVRYGLETPDEGIKVAEHHTGAVLTDPDERAYDTSPEAESRVNYYVEHWLPGLDPYAITAATCLYTSTPDHEFFVERHGPLVVVSACSGHGFKFTPLIGRQAADLAMQ